MLGVLVEKAKTTPEAYPLSLNALRTGCNQKNNRSPLMQLEESQVEDALEKLRKSGAVVASAGQQPRRSVSPPGLRMARRGKGRARRDGRAAAARRPNGRRAARPGRPHGADQRPGRVAADARFARGKGPDSCISRRPAAAASSPTRCTSTAKWKSPPRSRCCTRRGFSRLRDQQSPAAAASASCTASERIAARRPQQRSRHQPANATARSCKELVAANRSLRERA